ncbi:MAG TPA: ATP synthase F1 subunit delta [Planctomycetaceae bacterium]|nr:ATP synthase F1 subunit delta [Planctomycetaceae bacterium]
MADLQQQARIRSVLDDPTVRSVARVYAVALLDAVGNGDVAAVLEEARSFITAVLDPNPKFERLLTSAALPLEDKLKWIEKVVAPAGTPIFTNMLRVLAKHDRLDIVRSVIDTLEREIEDRSGRKRVKVTSALPLSDTALAAIRTKLTSSLAADPILETSVDPALLGGVVIRIGDTVYDGSMRNRLKQLRARLRERCLNEVQRGRDRFRHPEGN